MALYTKVNHILYKAFATTFRGSAFMWFMNLPTHSITSLHDFVKKFVARFITGVPTSRTSIHLFSVIQVPNETQRNYVSKFNNKPLQIQDLQIDIMVKVIKKGIWHRGFLTL